MIQVSIIPKAYLGLLFIFPASFTYKIDSLCDWDIYNCDNPYSIEQTLQFRCRHVDDCPINFMCCHHRCFRHKICQPYKTTRQTPKPLSNNFEIRSGECDVLVTCDTPLPEAFTKSFECLQDDDCPEYYKCCFVSCYNHKVCQPIKNVFGESSTESAILTKRTSVSEILYKTSAEFSMTETASSKRLTEGTTETIISKIVSSDIQSTTPTLTITEPTTIIESTLLEATSTQSFTESPTLLQQTDESLTKPITTAPTTNTDTATDQSLVEPTILTTQGTTTQATTAEILTELPILTPQVKVTMHTTTSKTLTETPLSTDDFEASGDLELTDDEDGRKEVENDTVNSTTTLQETKGINSITPSQSLITKLSTENDDFEASGDLTIIDDDEGNRTHKEDNRTQKKDNAHKLINNTTTSQWKTTKYSTESVGINQSHDKLTELVTDTDDFEITGVLEMTNDDEEKNNKEKEIDITTAVLKLLSSTTSFKLTSPISNSRETTVVTQAQPFKESTKHPIGNGEGMNKTEDYITTTRTTTELTRNNKTSTVTTTYGTRTSGFKEVTVNTTLAQPFTESTELKKTSYFEPNSDLGTIGDDEDDSTKKEHRATTFSNTNITTFMLTTLQQVKTSNDSEATTVTIQTHPLRVSTEFTRTVDFGASGDSGVIGDDESMDIRIDHTTTTKLGNTEIVTLTTTQRSTSTNNSVENTAKINQSQTIEVTTGAAEDYDSAASGDFELIGDDEDGRRDHQEEVIATKFVSKTETTAPSHQTESSKVTVNDSIKIAHPESDDFEASGDLEIIGDDEEETKKI